jgi:hypothetical protein
MPSIFDPVRRAAFERDGFVLFPSLLNADEIAMYRSDQNRSPSRRWTVLFCYNAARNNPYIEHHHPQYTPLHKVDDDAILQAGMRHASESDDFFRKNFSNPPELKKRL